MKRVALLRNQTTPFGVDGMASQSIDKNTSEGPSLSAPADVPAPVAKAKAKSVPKAKAKAERKSRAKK